MNLDTQTLIHVGTELVVVGGIAFWLNKRIGADAKYDDLLKRLSAYEEIIEKQKTKRKIIIAKVVPREWSTSGITF